MKTLVLIRHGSAENSLSDKARRLTQKGREEVIKAKAFLADQNIVCNTLWASDASRTVETAEILAENYRKNGDLYLASRRAILAFISSQPDTVQTLAIVGHNPGLQEVLLSLVPGARQGFTPASIAVIALAVDSWVEVEVGGHRLQSFFSP